jgi:S1-C subfamily serine protease
MAPARSLVPKLQFVLNALVVAAVMLFFNAPVLAAERELTVDEFSVVKLTVKAVPGARSTNTLGPQREGTGVVIDSSGLVLTIGYLVTEADTIELATADGRKYPANVIGFDNTTGLGLVKSMTPLPIKPVDFGQSSAANLRDIVLIVGFDGVAPAYIVSKRPFVGYWEYLLDEAIYTAPATVNWQGAALLSREGKLLGIGSLAVGDAVGKSAVPGNMFVPIDTLKPVLGDFIANGRVTTKPRPWLGITSQEIQGKVIVTRVSAEGPAEEAGLRAGDIIVGLGGQPLTGQADFYTRLWKSGDAGVEVTLDVLKGNKIEPVKVKSMAREGHFRSKPVY